MIQNIGQKLLDLRGNRTRVQVAKGIGVSPQAIQMYETNQRVPRDDIKVRIAKFYGVSVEFLFYGGKSHVS